ncbi:MAG: AraC family transcriptional regulator [bacterium]|nr:AraC family transcriptional regulator [bacterium]
MNNKDPVFRSLAVIEENIQKKLTVESLARSIHLSGSRYQRLFREAVGDSVMSYVIRRRLALAAADLAETDESILDIALKYGYDSHEVFTRSFRAHMGVSPREYRKHRLSVCPEKTRKEKYPIDVFKKD